MSSSIPEKGRIGILILPGFKKMFNLSQTESEVQGSSRNKKEGGKPEFPLFKIFFYLI